MGMVEVVGTVAAGAVGMVGTAVLVSRFGRLGILGGGVIRITRTIPIIRIIQRHIQSLPRNLKNISNKTSRNQRSLSIGISVKIRKDIIRI